MEQFPSNSHSKTEKAPPNASPPEITSVVVGNVVRKKPSLGRRFRETFIKGDAKSVMVYVTYEILIPALKDLVNDAVSMGTDRLLNGGESRGSSPGRRARAAAGNSIINYSNYSKGSRYSGREETRQISRTARAQHNFDEILLETRVEAETVIERLSDLCNQYQVAKVSDLYDLVGATGEFTDEKYGWYDMVGARAVRVPGGLWLIDLPRPELLRD